MRERTLGSTATRVSVVGYGAMALSLERVPEDEAIQTLHRVFDLGVTLIDTASSYCDDERDQHHNEKLVARALASYGAGAARVCVATKGGAIRVDRRWRMDGSPDHLYRSICESHEALGGRAPIPLWQHHWPDARYPVRESMQAVRRAVDEGLIRHVGVSNYSVAQVEEARTVVDIVSVQNQYNLWCRDPERDGVLAWCERENIAFLPWRPLGGLGLAQRLDRAPLLRELAASRGVTPYRLMIAWFLARSPCLLPIPGSRRWSHAEDCLRAAELLLSPDEVARIAALAVADMPELETDPRPLIRPADGAAGG